MNAHVLLFCCTYDVYIDSNVMHSLSGFVRTIHVMYVIRWGVHWKDLKVYYTVAILQQSHLEIVRYKICNLDLC